jgi:hypothetical protein
MSPAGGLIGAVSRSLGHQSIELLAESRHGFVQIFDMFL